MDDDELSKHLFPHTKDSVANKRKRMGLKRSNRKYDFQDVINEFEKRGYILLSSEDDYIDSATNSLKYLCPKHIDKGVQTISLGHLQSGRGCYYCGRKITENARRIDPLQNIEECKLLCASKNFTFVDVFKEGQKYKIKYICNKHPEAGIQEMTKGNMGRNFINGCPHCIDFNRSKHSKGECKIKDFLDLNNITYISQYTFDNCRDKCKLPFDFFIPANNCCIEYDGQHHYYPVCYNGISIEEAQYNHEQTVKHDFIKDEYCKQNNIEILRIPYFDFEIIESKLRDFLF